MNTQYIFEIFGTFSFAMSGALAVSEKDQEQDWLGVGFIGFVTAIGGGSLRDMLLGSYPLVWVQDIRLLYTILAAILCTGLFYQQLVKLRRTLLLFDTIGISLFTIVGTEKALSLGIRPEIAAIMGMFTAVMGGVIRDTLTNVVPAFFRKEVYATACLLGAALYILLAHFEVARNVNFIASVMLIFVIRLAAIKYKLTVPNFHKPKQNNSRKTLN